MDYDIENELRSNLVAGEKFIWTGRPKTGLLLRSSDTYMIPFSLMWGGFAIFWETSVIRSGGPFFFMLWGIPFVLAGLYIIVGRFFVNAKQRANTIYGITEERIIIKSGIFRSEIKSLNIKVLSDISFKESADKSGTIMLGAVNPRYYMMQGINFGNTMQMPPMLEAIEDAKTVYDKIIELQRKK